MYLFKDRINTQKGEIGQKLLEKYFPKVFPKLKLYRCSNQNKGSHQCDGLIMDKDKIIAYYDVKTKPRRFKFEDTGIDYYAFQNYQKLAKNNQSFFYLFFVDQLTKQIYFNQLNVLKKNSYIKKHYEDTIIYFLLKDMRVLTKLNQEDCCLLKQKTLMNYNYINKYSNIKTCSQIINQNYKKRVQNNG